MSARDRAPKSLSKGQLLITPLGPVSRRSRRSARPRRLAVQRSSRSGRSAYHKSRARRATTVVQHGTSIERTRPPGGGGRYDLIAHSNRTYASKRCCPSGADRRTPASRGLRPSAPMVSTRGLLARPNATSAAHPRPACRSGTSTSTPRPCARIRSSSQPVLRRGMRLRCFGSPAGPIRVPSRPRAARPGRRTTAVGSVWIRRPIAHALRGAGKPRRLVGGLLPLVTAGEGAGVG